MFPIKYKARDGLLIRGYLTVPKGQKPEKLPLVMMPHGGPWARDVWGFDPLVQMLANRGYAVLQVNFRGSIGYGDEFAEKGRKEFGGAVQHDIEDGTRWAIAQGIADPKRVAIVGGSFGGYCALHALGKSRDLYRCGVAMAAVTDWADIIKRADNAEYRLAHQHWIKQLGDPKIDRAALDAISPVNFAKDIAAPVLLIHGRDDRTVPIAQAKKMASALEAAGRPPSTLYFFGEGHNTSEEKNRIEELKRIESFLAQHMRL
jgi:dipeptidyl aminopeptidase/acylaminoacyl peptidase